MIHRFKAAQEIGAILGLTTATLAVGQTRLSNQVPANAASGQAVTGPTATTSLRARFGTEIATRLARSGDPDERLRGIERLASIHTPEALGLLERAVGPAIPGVVDQHAPLDGVARADPRALLVVVQSLAAWLDRDSARAALAGIVSAPTQSFATHPATARSPDPSADGARGSALILLARQEAAIALAEAGSGLSFEALIAIARSGGPGQGPALDALAIHPPEPPLLGGVVLTTPATIALAATVGDLRSLDAIEGAMSASDPAIRAAALVALGLAGDSRVIEAARAALHDHDARVRLAAGDALVRLGTPEGALAVEQLVGDDSTARDALGLAQLVQSDGVTKALAARAMVTGNAEIRAAAVAALGRQTSALAIGVLSTLATDATIRGDVAYALARSPNVGALAAIDAMAGAASSRRMAARAYLVRRLVRDERSAPLDALLETLAGSADARDRSVGVQALVALGVRGVAPSLEDDDARVRRAAAMGAYPRWGAASRSALLARLTVETDVSTRQVLALGLVDGDAGGVVPTDELLDRARGGGPDAPLSALALSQRTDELRAADVEAMLEGSDPVLRAHVARGLGLSAAPDALGRLARVYAKEGDVEVRRAVIAALSAHGGEAASAPMGRETLQLAARLDPDGLVRRTALRALAAAPAAARHPLVRDVVWLRLIPAEGATLPRDMMGALVDGDGVALPIAFDDDGYALIPGVAPGGASVRLAPRPPPYEALSQ